MTGEITLRGEVLPIGGLKEKLLAAHRGGITTVLIPDENEKDLAEIPENIKGKLEIKPVKWIDEVLEIALQQHAAAAVAADRRSSQNAAVVEAKRSKRPGRRAGQGTGALIVRTTVRPCAAVAATNHRRSDADEQERR